MKRAVGRIASDALAGISPWRRRQTRDGTRMTAMATEEPSSDIRRSYVTVMIVWVVVIAGLYAMQRYFS
jgi:hypothetical protein